MITLYEKSEDFILNLKNELQPVINEDNSFSRQKKHIFFQDYLFSYRWFYDTIL